MDTDKTTERPILFSGAMVRAILRGRKTQTRRVVRCGSKHKIYNLAEARVDGGPKSLFCDGQYLHVPFRLKLDEREEWLSERVFCPCGQPGDRLWVRETFSHQPQLNAGAYYRADDPLVGVSRWTPAIHMPRTLSRITLEITDVRVERLQDISEEDAKAEGVEEIEIGDWWGYRNYLFETAHPVGRVYKKRHVIGGYVSAISSFESLWDSINQARGYGWKSNPYVWAITFKEVKP